MNKPIAYLNGEYIPNDKCVLPIYDAGIVLSAAVTDLLRTFGGKPFAAQEHVHRFFESARYAYIDLKMSEEEMLAIVEHLVSKNTAAWGKREIAMVFYATAGQFPVYAGAAGMAGELRATVCLHCFPLPLKLWASAMRDGVHVVTPAQRHFPPGTLNSKIKHRNRLHMWIGDQQARLVDPKAVGLYLDQNGSVTETGGSNFVIYKDGVVISPQRDNILWGVSLENLRRISLSLGLGFELRDLQIHDVVNADEAWLCTTPYFLAPAVKINGLSIGDGQPGPVWRKLLDAFSAEVGVDVAKQILEAENDEPVSAETDRG